MVFATLSTWAMLSLLAPPGGQDGLREAQRDLESALNPVSASRVRSAADRLVAVNTADAVRALTRALPALAQVQARLAPEIEEKNRQIAALNDQAAANGNMLDMDSFQRLNQLESDVASQQRDFNEAASAATEIKSAFRRFTSEDAAGELIDMLRANDPDLRAIAAIALTGMPRNETLDPRILDATVARFRSEREDDVKVALIDLVKSRGQTTDAVRDLLGHALEDPSWRVVLAAAQAVRDLNVRDLVPGIIGALEHADGRLKAELNRVLVALSGYDYRGDATGWQAWWDQFGADFVAGNYTRPEGAQEGSGGTVTFFGVPIESRRLVFVLDRSGSMESPTSYRRANFTGGGNLPPNFPSEPAGNRKIDVLRYEMRLTLTMLPDGTIFNILMYHHEFVAFRDTLVQLSDQTRAAAIQWVEGMDPEGATNVYDPTEQALNWAPVRAADNRRLPASMRGGIDTILLMSDGFPNHGKITEPDAIRQAIADLNRLRRVRIDTIFLGERGERQGADFLESISTENGGRHVRYIDN